MTQKRRIVLIIGVVALSAVIVAGVYAQASAPIAANSAPSNTNALPVNVRAQGNDVAPIAMQAANGAIGSAMQYTAPGFLACRTYVDPGTSPVVDVELIGGDVDGNGVIDRADFRMVEDVYGQQGRGLSADFNADGTVGLHDLNLVAINMGARSNLCATQTRIEIVDGNGLAGIQAGELFTINVYSYSSEAHTVNLTVDAAALSINDIRAAGGFTPVRQDVAQPAGMDALIPQAISLALPSSAEGRVISVQAVAVQSGTSQVMAESYAPNGNSEPISMTLNVAAPEQIIATPNAPLPVAPRTMDSGLSSPNSIQPLSEPAASAPLPVGER
jgi:hypothetical protein